MNVSSRNLEIQISYWNERYNSVSLSSNEPTSLESFNSEYLTGLNLNALICQQFILGRFENSHGLWTALKGSSPDLQGPQRIKSADFHFDCLIFFLALWIY